ncbi:hypothetical protein OSG_eHP31_00075 [environmental Halophage eHP-31]|nr:hypothetical protein OSG_eHP31_00075 [environmental Halophage eHP-31]
MKIEQSHGYLLDSEGRVVTRFANWDIGSHPVPDHVDTVEYVDGPAAHSKPVDDAYKPDSSDQ